MKLVRYEYVVNISLTLTFEELERIAKVARERGNWKEKPEGMRLSEILLEYRLKPWADIPLRASIDQVETWCSALDKTGTSESIRLRSELNILVATAKRESTRLRIEKKAP